MKTKFEYLRTLIKFKQLNEMKQMTEIAQKSPISQITTFYNRMRYEFDEMFEMNSIKKNHDELIKLEEVLHKTSEKRRKAQMDVSQIQLNLQELRNEIFKTDRRDNNFVHLIVKENKLVKDEDQLKELLKETEEIEKELFSIFSNKLKGSYQLDLIRQHKQRFFSTICALFGALITYILTYIKNKSDLNVFFGNINNRFSNLEEKIDNVDSKENLFMLQSIYHKLDDLMSTLKRLIYQPQEVNATKGANGNSDVKEVNSLGWYKDCIVNLTCNRYVAIGLVFLTVLLI